VVIDVQFSVAKFTTIHGLSMQMKEDSEVEAYSVGAIDGELIYTVGMNIRKKDYHNIVDTFNQKISSNSNYTMYVSLTDDYNELSPIRYRFALLI
jgi:hypothetical protein